MSAPAALRRTHEGADELLVHDPYTGQAIGSVPRSAPGDVDLLLARARAGFEIARGLTRFERHGILERAGALLQARADEATRLIVREAGKTVRQARKEVRRAVSTLSLSAEAARSNAGEVIPFDAFEGSANRRGWFTREPLGLVVAITPYNDALNLVAHKLGPAVAAGDSVILKPSPFAPLTARFLVGLLIDAGLPPEVVTVVHGDRDLAQALVAARDVRLVSFTGGFATGEAIARGAGLKRLAMELGGNAPVLVFADADIPAAVEACVSGAFWAAGQNCVGAQRILVQREVHDRFRAAFIARTQELIVGDPSDERTDVGPMISRDAAERAERLVDRPSPPARTCSPDTGGKDRSTGRPSSKAPPSPAPCGATKRSPPSPSCRRSTPRKRPSPARTRSSTRCTPASSRRICPARCACRSASRRAA